MAIPLACQFGTKIISAQSETEIGAELVKNIVQFPHLLNNFQKFTIVYSFWVTTFDFSTALNYSLFKKGKTF